MSIPRRRSWLSRLAVPAAVIVAGYLGRFFSADFLTNPWLSYGPGKAIGYWLLGTPLRAMAPRVRFFSLYMPDYIVGFVIGGLAGYLFPRHWRRLGLLAGLAMVFNWPYAIAGLVHTAAAGRWGSVVFFSLVLAAYPLSTLAGAFVAVRFLAKKPPDPMQCRMCGYSLKGLIVNRCPECGTKFDAGLLGDGSTIADEHTKSKDVPSS